PLFPGFASFFNADNSWTKYGTIVSYDWNFGDGSFATGSHASHTFQSPGGYNVVLTVQNTWGLAGTASRVVVVEDIPPIPLVAYSHPSGFRLPVPQAWAWSPDEVDRGLKLDLVLRGPVHDNFRTNIIVQSIHDQSVAEDRASMERLVSSLLEELRSADPGLSVTEPFRVGQVGTLPPPPATAVLKQFCTNCGTPITGARRFCGHCGVAIGGSSVPYDLPDEF